MRAGIKSTTKSTTKKRGTIKTTIKNRELLEYYCNSRIEFGDNVSKMWEALMSIRIVYAERVGYLLNFLKKENLVIDDEKIQDKIDWLKEDVVGPFDYELVNMDDFDNIKNDFNDIEEFINDKTNGEFNNFLKDLIIKRDEEKEGE